VFSENEGAKGRGEGSLFPSSNKSCLKVVSRETSSLTSLHFVLALGMAQVEDQPEMGPMMGKGQHKVVQNPPQRKI
jgi:hypothetical protein